jgi:hypothetical protein
VTDIPHEVLSDHFQERMGGRRLLAAVFATYQFDPGFFEREILPVFLDVTLSHAPAIKLVQLEDTLRSLAGGIAVYYDANGLVLTDDGAAKLDVRRIPMRVRTGLFHPKNVFALVEDVEPDESGAHPRTLLVAALSANLTRSGWWHNVEVCHIEELAERSPTNMRDDLRAFFKRLRDLAPEGCDHGALDTIDDFVKGTEKRAQRKVQGDIQPHFFSGNRPFDEFLAEVLGNDARDLYLEVISPYFDKDDEPAPLAQLVRRFRPRAVRVSLPRSPDGEAQVTPAMHAWVAGLDDATWGKLPAGMLRSGKGEDARPRFVHAKVYRFFSMQKRLEYLAVGSVNLTRPAHQRGGNLESALIIQTAPPRRPDFWLEPDLTRPTSFGSPEHDDDGDLAAADTGSRLTLRYHWNGGTGEARWDADAPSPRLELEANGASLCALESLAPRAWSTLATPHAEALGALLVSTSFVTVRGDRPEPVIILVLEEGMWKKPPLLSRLSVRDILQYWSLLTAEQRNEFLQLRAAQLLGSEAHNELVTRLRATVDVNTIFDRFAGIFHAFECVAKSVETALTADNEKEALYRVFGTKHDSLGSLLLRLREDRERDAVEQYVIVMCARQLCRELRTTWPDFWSRHAADVADLDDALRVCDDLRSALLARGDADTPAFLDWFDSWFLRKAQRLEEPT